MTAVGVTTGVLTMISLKNQSVLIKSKLINLLIQTLQNQTLTWQIIRQNIFEYYFKSERQ